jgi:hypothetical protein
MKNVCCFLVPDGTQKSEKQALEIPAGTCLSYLRAELVVTPSSYFCRYYDDPQALERFHRLSEVNHKLEDNWTYVLFPVEEAAISTANHPTPPPLPTFNINNSSNNSSVNHVNVYVPRHGEAKKMAAPMVKPRYLQPTIFSAYGMGPSKNPTARM